MSYTRIREKAVTVRKKHSCVWCGESINIGEKVYYRVYTMDDVFTTDYLHPECKEALHRSDDLSEGFSFGEFQRGESAEESINERQSIATNHPTLEETKIEKEIKFSYFGWLKKILSSFMRNILTIYLFWKAPLSKAIRMFSSWEYYFSGITIKQFGFGIIWRKRKENG